MDITSVIGVIFILALNVLNNCRYLLVITNLTSDVNFIISFKLNVNAKCKYNHSVVNLGLKSQISDL